MPSSEPKRTSRSEAVLSPMPGMPGMSSEVSPLSPMKSGISRARCRIGPPRARACTRAPRTRRAARAGRRRDRRRAGRRRGRGRSRTSGSPASSARRLERADDVVGLVALVRDVLVAERLHQRPELRLLLAQEVRASAARVALYPGKRSRRCGRPLVPGHDARRAGGSRPSSRMSMLVNPSRAFVGKPSVVASSSGSAKKAPVGERVAVDQEELGRLRRRVVEVEILRLGDHEGTVSGSRLRILPRCVLFSWP